MRGDAQAEVPAPHLATFDGALDRDRRSHIASMTSSPLRREWSELESLFEQTVKAGFDRWISFRGQGTYRNPLLNFDGTRKKVQGYITDILTE